MSDHTPIPWKAEVDDGSADGIPGQNVIGADEWPVAGMVDFTGKEQLNEANAAFIVTACNNHQALLDALNRCVNHFEDSVAALPEWGVGREIIIAARAAIEQATS